jgi:hypothetical protein
MQDIDDGVQFSQLNVCIIDLEEFSSKVWGHTKKVAVALHTSRIVDV